MKYWHPEKKEWHENIKGIYHVSSIGTNHQDIDYEDHSGPCLRQTYWEYTDPLPNSDATEGNFEQGREMHERLQKIIKEWKPNTVIEKPLAKIFERGEQKILIVGSIDIEYKHIFNLDRDDSKTKKKISIWDIKTASDYTLPADEDDINITHFDQVIIYGTLDVMYELHPDFTEMKGLKIIYINKHQKATHPLKRPYDFVEGVEKLRDCIDRSFYLDECLTKSEIPVPEPMHWCKFCKYRSRCMAQGDVEIILNTRGNIKGLKVIDNA